MSFFTDAGTAFLAAAGHFIYRGPSAAFGFADTGAAIFISFFDMFGLPFLFVGVTGFVSLWHNFILIDHFPSWKDAIEKWAEY